MIARKRFRDLSYFYVAKSARARILEKIRAPQISVSQLNAEGKDFVRANVIIHFSLIFVYYMLGIG